ncbi:MAG: type I DNA topoisomerase, partial [Acidimicrobiaceae bacterium]|nr:type I DNA topoisomerase [Acidimicrobiaceae bacterium]
MANALVIVESPAKAKTISGYLGHGYVVESSIGHIRDLPSRAAEVPKAYKSEPWARLGIDVDNEFKPLYVVNSDKRQQVRKLKDLLADADELYLATDEDREGEAIAWHLMEVLSPRVPVKRMIFHEITRAAISAAVAAPRELDRRLVDAQEARRMLDRLYGYEVSPVLWKKVMPQLSAGRVQSVAVRIVVERERERMDFVSAGFWGLTGTFAPADSGGGNGGGGATFAAELVQLDGSRIAAARDFGPDGRPTRGDVTVLDEAAATALVSDLQHASFSVRARTSKPYRRRPAAPFITSTLQQEAARKLHMTSAAAMRTAQSLYEKGYITYMRTDSTSLSSGAVASARAEIAKRYGPALLPPEPRVYASKVKNAQEAHEAIRPAGDTFTDPSTVANQLPRPEARLYELVWQRTLASQMTDCTGETVQLRVGATSASGRDAEFSASGTVITHLGFREVYTEGTDAGEASD